MAIDRKAWEISEISFPKSGSPEEKARFLLGYARLAPSPLNSQPWKFKVEGSPVGARISVLGDFSRARRVADPERRELHISLGCAVANILVAADKFGAAAAAEFPVEGLAAAIVTLDFPAAAEAGTEVGTEPQAQNEAAHAELSAKKRAFTDEMFAAMTKRSTSAEDFEGSEMPEPVLEALGKSVVGGEEMLLSLVTGAEPKGKIAAVVKASEERLAGKREYRKEVAAWARSDWDGRGDGLSGASLGYPGLLSLLASVLVASQDWSRKEADEAFSHASSAPLLAVLSTETDDRQAWIRAGIALELFWLTSEAAGYSVQLLSSATEDAGARLELRGIVGQTGFPQAVMRVGKAGLAHHSARRSLEEVVEK